MFKINFSGHPVAGFEVQPFVGVNLPATGEELSAYVRETLLSIPNRPEILAGAVCEVVLPGLAQATAIFLAEWHGQFGNWPCIKWAVRGASGFEWPENAKSDLNALREAARTAR